MGESELDWTKLLSPMRYQGEGRKLKCDNLKDSEVRSPFVKDVDKIVYSSAFRRLKDKTQVHTFPGSDYVRTRLTHSLEVASVGRTLGMTVQRYLHEKGKLKPLKDEFDHVSFGSVVAAASLIHDIGNPPFGHAGEQAIRHWIQRGPYHEGLKPRERFDLEYFEGNAQGFRILTRLQAWRNEGGLRLTCATLGAFQKYPMGSADKDDRHRKKFGFFQHDREAMKTIVQFLGLIPFKNEAYAWYRHPLAILVEAADDICNAIADLEDGYKYKKISYDNAYDLLKQIASESGWGKPLNRKMTKKGKTYTSDEKIAYLRAEAIGALIWQSVQVYKRHETSVMKGASHDRLMEKVKSRDTLKEIEKVTKRNLFEDESTVKAELAGFEVIHGLLEIFTEALWEWDQVNFKYERLPPRYQKVFDLLTKSAPIPKVRYQWLLSVTDYISGMTDTFAVELFRRLKGISIGEALH